jgi:hypothetical protein
MLIRLKLSTKNRILYVLFFLLIEINPHPIITPIILWTSLAVASMFVFKFGDVYPI